MKNKEKTKAELIEETKVLQKRIAELEKSESEHKKTRQLVIETDRRLQEHAQRSYSQLQNVIEKNPDGIAILDKDGIILSLNQAMISLFGRKREELMGKPFGFPVVTGEATEIDIIRRGETATAEMRVGEIEWEGKPAYLASIRDITERKRAEQLKDEFISTVSHELRTPLTTMKEFVSIVLDEIPGKINKDQKEYLSIVKGNIDRLARIIASLLDISKIEARRMELRRTLVNIIGLVKDVVTSLKARADAKHIRLKTSFPRATSDVYVDPDRIAQVFTNLIDNAIKFTQEGGSVAVDIRARKKEIKCSVSDTGVGIAPENRDKVFEKFQQIGRTAGPGPKGTGLGLPITKELVQMHKGRMWVESEAGKGSKFLFTLPRYSIEEILYEAIGRKITEVKHEHKELSLFITRLDNCVEIKERSGEEKEQKVQPKIMDALENVMRNGDLVIRRGENEVIVLAQINRQEVPKLNARLKRIVKESILEVDEKLEIDFSCGYSTYPDDATNVKELLEKAQKNVVSEEKERLRKHIMIVDDEPDFVELLRDILREMGYSNISEACSGYGALEEVKADIPDLIILDMHMPGMSGYEVIGRLKANTETKHIPILIMTAHKVKYDKLTKYVKKNAIPIVSKPVSIDQIKKLLKFLL